MTDNPRNAPKLVGRRILITGAGSGIGRATASLFAMEGARLALLDKDGVALSGVGRPGMDVSAPIDLTNFGELRAAVDGLAQVLGGLDGVVNCAGAVISKPVAELELEDWQSALDINLTVPFLVCKYALPWLLQQKSATIANIASAQALMPNVAGLSSYAASKAGVIALTKAMAAELGPAIRANVLCPGMTVTPMVAPILDQFERHEDVPFIQNYALKRPAQPIEMAKALLFLTSDDSSYMTGSTLVVDGGRTFF